MATARQLIEQVLRGDHPSRVLQGVTEASTTAKARFGGVTWGRLSRFTAAGHGQELIDAHEILAKILNVPRREVVWIGSEDDEPGAHKFWAILKILKSVKAQETDISHRVGDYGRLYTVMTLSGPVTLVHTNSSGSNLIGVAEAELRQLADIPEFRRIQPEDD